MKMPYTKSGKCGNLVWQRNRYGQICYTAFVPYNPRTHAQVAVRGNFRAVSARWRALTQEQRDVWIAVAATMKTKPRLFQCGELTGFNFFVKLNVGLANRGIAQVDLPPEHRRLPKRAVSGLLGGGFVSKQETGREPPDILTHPAPLNLVRTRSTASLTSPGMNGTRWNASLPGQRQLFFTINDN
jgi:hypothetical protein